ncbi:hypothetical protein [Aeromonas veronii]|uniref:hypothetical protein n=1 Tax=Aeromonas veronii TaxID=654 RepID=UPI00301B9C18
MAWEDTPPEILRLATFLNDFYKESDRGAVLMAGSILDEVLSGMISAFLIDSTESKKLLEGFNAPLGTFSSRILAAYSLGLIEEQEFSEVEAIRKIRNMYGHAWNGIDFNHPKVMAQLEKLPFSDETARVRLNHTVANLLGDWLWRESYIIEEKRKMRTWPNKSGFGRHHSKK